MSALQAAMTRVVLDDAEASGIRAVVWLERADARLTIPCYPPDALGLALRAKVPIYATAEALAHARPLTTTGDVPRPGPAEVSRWLQGVSPDDF
jgi:bifunctional DNase/RNase